MYRADPRMQIYFECYHSSSSDSRSSASASSSTLCLPCSGSGFDVTWKHLWWCCLYRFDCFYFGLVYWRTLRQLTRLLRCPWGWRSKGIIDSRCPCSPRSSRTREYSCASPSRRTCEAKWGNQNTRSSAVQRMACHKSTSLSWSCRFPRPHQRRRRRLRQERRHLVLENALHQHFKSRFCIFFFDVVTHHLCKQKFLHLLHRQSLSWKLSSRWSAAQAPESRVSIPWMSWVSSYGDSNARTDKNFGENKNK